MTTTLKAYRSTLVDNIFKSKILLWILQAAGRIENQDGGTAIVQPLMYKAAPNKGSYSGSDVFETAAPTGLTSAEFPWRQFYGLISIEGIEMAKNQGRPAIMRLLATRLKQIEMTISEELETMLWGDGSGNGQKDFYGLAAIVDSSDPAWGDFGGIDRTASTGAYWRAKETDPSTTLALTQMRTMYNDVSEGNDHPSNILTTQVLYEAYEALVAASLQVEDTKLGDAGFQNLMWKGAPIAFSSDATTGEMLFLNMQYIHLSKLSGVWFQASELQQPTNQDVMYQHLKLYGNLNASNCARQGKLVGLTNT